MTIRPNPPQRPPYIFGVSLSLERHTPVRGKEDKVTHFSFGLAAKAPRKNDGKNPSIKLWEENQAANKRKEEAEKTAADQESAARARELAANHLRSPYRGGAPSLGTRRK